MLIDCHAHVGPTWLGTDPLTPDRLVSWMDEHQLDRIVLLPLESPSGASYCTTTRSILDAADQFSDRFIPFCSIDPRIDVGLGNFVETRRDGFKHILEKFIARGARGFGEVKCELPIDDERMQLLYELCGEYSLPMLFHLDDRSMLDAVGLPGLERMLNAYPETDFIMHSHGWWSHISKDVGPADIVRGALPDGPVIEGGRCDELLETYDNIYADISAGSGWNALVRDEAYTEAFLERHNHQILFGTDKSYVGFEPSHFDLFDRFTLSDEARANISHRNLRRIIRN